VPSLNKKKKIQNNLSKETVEKENYFSPHNFLVSRKVKKARKFGHGASCVKPGMKRWCKCRNQSACRQSNKVSRATGEEEAMDPVIGAGA
jgi:hypothetical protein